MKLNDLLTRVELHHHARQLSSTQLPLAASASSFLERPSSSTVEVYFQASKPLYKLLNFDDSASQTYPHSAWNYSKTCRGFNVDAQILKHWCQLGIAKTQYMMLICLVKKYKWALKQFVFLPHPKINTIIWLNEYYKRKYFSQNYNSNFTPNWSVWLFTWTILNKRNKTLNSLSLTIGNYHYKILDLKWGSYAPWQTPSQL